MKTLPAARLPALLTESSTPVIIDFGADWCLPCRRLEPLLDAAAGRFEGRVTVRRIDTALSPDLIARFNIQSIPTLVAFTGQTETARLTGLPRPDALTRFFEDALSAG